MQYQPDQKLYDRRWWFILLLSTSRQSQQLPLILRFIKDLQFYEIKLLYHKKHKLFTLNFAICFLRKLHI